MKERAIEAAAQELVRYIAGYPAADPWPSLGTPLQGWYLNAMKAAIGAYLETP
jgi:hypothetical protein